MLFLAPTMGEFHVFEIMGKAIVKTVDGKTTYLKEGEVLANEEVVITNEKTNLSVLLSDFSYLNIGINTAFKLVKKDKKLFLHLFRGQVRAFHSDKSFNFTLVTPVKDLEGRGKMDFVAEVFEDDELPRLDLVMLRGSFYDKHYRYRSGSRLMASWEELQSSEIGPDFENLLVANEKAFLSGVVTPRRDFEFEVELEWETKVAVISNEPKREIASEELEEMELEEFEEPISIKVHETVHDAINRAASSVMEKAEWYKNRNLNNYDYRKDTLKMAVDKIAVKSFYEVKKRLESSFEYRVDEFTRHIVGEKKLELTDREIFDSLQVFTSQHVEELTQKTLYLSNEIFPKIKEEIQQRVIADVTEDAFNWSYKESRKLAENSYKKTMKQFNLNPPEGIEDLLDKVATTVSRDFSKILARSISDQFAHIQTNEVMDRAKLVALPVVEKKLKRMYQNTMITEVRQRLIKGRARAIASQKTEEMDKKKLQYQVQEYNRRNRGFIRNSRN